MDGLAGAESYTVSIYDEALHLVKTSQPLQQAEWTVPDRLKAGTVFTWVVTALKDGKVVVAPAAPARAEFMVIGQIELIQLERRITGVTSIPARGIVYAEAGLLDSAEQEFRAYLASNPTDKV